VNDGDRARWLHPSPPIAVDGEEPGAPKRVPPPPPRDEQAPAADEPEPEPGAEDDTD
jgi:hypothetical protein